MMIRPQQAEYVVSELKFRFFTPKFDFCPTEKQSIEKSLVLYIVSETRFLYISAKEGQKQVIIMSSCDLVVEPFILDSWFIHYLAFN